METSTAPSSAARCSRNTSRTRFRDSAKRVIHRPAGLLTTRRRFQTKERVHPVGNGVFLSFIGSNPILSRLRPLFRDFVVRWYGKPAGIPGKPPDFLGLRKFSSLLSLSRLTLAPPVGRIPDTGNSGMDWELIKSRI